MKHNTGRGDVATQGVRLVTGVSMGPWGEEQTRVYSAVTACWRGEVPLRARLFVKGFCLKQLTKLASAYAFVLR